MITYRTAQTSDFLDIAALDREAWGKNRNTEFVPDGEHIWRVWVEYAIVECAFENDKVIGVGLSIPTTDPKLYFHHKLFLRDGYRGQNIGSKLTENRFKRTDELGAATIFTTDTNNTVMHKIAAKHGYVEVDFVKGYYRPNEDRLIFRREAATIQANKKTLNL